MIGSLSREIDGAELAVAREPFAFDGPIDPAATIELDNLIVGAPRYRTELLGVRPELLVLGAQTVRARLEADSIVLDIARGVLSIVFRTSVDASDKKQRLLLALDRGAAAAADDQTSPMLTSAASPPLPFPGRPEEHRSRPPSSGLPFRAETGAPPSPIAPVRPAAPGPTMQFDARPASPPVVAAPSSASPIAQRAPAVEPSIVHASRPSAPPSALAASNAAADSTPKHDRARAAARVERDPPPEELDAVFVDAAAAGAWASLGAKPRRGYVRATEGATRPSESLGAEQIARAPLTAPSALLGRERRPTSAVVAGELTFDLRPREELGGLVAFAERAKRGAPLDRVLEEAKAALENGWLSDRALRPHVERLSEALASAKSSGREIVRRACLERGLHVERLVLGESHLVGRLASIPAELSVPSGAGTSAAPLAFPIYVPSRFRASLPLFDRFSVRALITLHARADEAEASAVSARAVALFRLPS